MRRVKEVTKIIAVPGSKASIAHATRQAVVACLDGWEGELDNTDIKIVFTTYRVLAEIKEGK